MIHWFNILTQAIGFLGVLFFFISYQAKSNKSLFLLQVLGCLTFSVQFILLGAFGGCASLLVNIARNLMLTKYKKSKLIRRRGWALIFHRNHCCCRTPDMERLVQYPAAYRNKCKYHSVLDKQCKEYSACHTSGKFVRHLLCQ